MLLFLLQDHQLASCSIKGHIQSAYLRRTLLFAHLCHNRRSACARAAAHAGCHKQQVRACHQLQQQDNHSSWQSKPWSQARAAGGGRQNVGRATNCC